MAIINFDTPKGSATNTSTCSSMVKYLEKEDEEKGLNKEFFFNHRKNMIPAHVAKEEIDSRKKGLGKEDAKFYSGSINFSQDELAFLNNDKEKIKNYVCEVFKLYAANFKREGLTIDNINWFGKLEDNRYYKGTDKEVVEGKKKLGDVKPELNTHVHFIVGRKSLDNKLKLSPKTNHRSTKAGVVKGGFDRERFIIGCERLFDEMFQYNRPNEQSYKYQHELKNGSSDEKIKHVTTTENKKIAYKNYNQLTDSEKEKKISKLINFIRFGHEGKNYSLDKNQILEKAKQLNWNGDVYRSLLNLNQKIKQGKTIERDVTGFVIKYVDFLNKSYMELPNSIKEDRLLNYIQMLNSKMQEDLKSLDTWKLIDIERKGGYEGQVMNGLNRLNFYLKKGNDIGSNPNKFVLQSINVPKENSISFQDTHNDIAPPSFIPTTRLLNSHPEEDDDHFFKKKKKRRRLW